MTITLSPFVSQFAGKTRTGFRKCWVKKTYIWPVLKSNWLFHVNPFKTESCNECPHNSWQQIWKGQAKKPTTRLFDLCLYRQSVIGVEHSNSDSFTLLVNWIRWCLIELSPKRTCHGRLALLGPHGDAISTRLDASLTKTEEATRVEFKSSGSLKKNKYKG